jgi:hypothetical protein
MVVESSRAPLCKVSSANQRKEDRTKHTICSTKDQYIESNNALCDELDLLERSGYDRHTFTSLFSGMTAIICKLLDKKKAGDENDTKSYQPQFESLGRCWRPCVCVLDTFNQKLAFLLKKHLSVVSEVTAENHLESGIPNIPNKIVRS